jgi:hypothetical protein
MRQTYIELIWVIVWHISCFQFRQGLAFAYSTKDEQHQNFFECLGLLFGGWIMRQLGLIKLYQPIHFDLFLAKKFLGYHYPDKYIHVWMMRYYIKIYLKVFSEQFCGFLFVFLFGTLFSYSQVLHLDERLFKEGLLELKFKDAWRYQPGDNPVWAEPNFDDTD